MLEFNLITKLNRVGCKYMNLKETIVNLRKLKQEVWDYMERTEQHRMYTENANRSSGDGIITPDNMEPNPKNPIIASFFRNIGWSDRLGSGVRNIFKYSKYYSGEEPEFVEGDVFRIIVPLNEDYSYDNVKNGDKKTAIKNGDKKRR